MVLRGLSQSLEPIISEVGFLVGFSFFFLLLLQIPSIPGASNGGREASFPQFWLPPSLNYCFFYSFVFCLRHTIAGTIDPAVRR